MEATPALTDGSNGEYMRVPISMLIALSAAGCSTQQSRALPAMPAGPAYFSCDAPPGQYRQKTHPIGNGDFSASGTLQFKQSRNDPDWSPGAWVFVVMRDGHKVGLRFAGLRDRPRRLQAQLVFAPKAWQFVGTTPSEAPLPFSVSLRQDGLMHVTTAAGLSASQHVDGQPAAVVFGCDTAAVEFGGVRFSDR